MNQENFQTRQAVSAPEALERTLAMAKGPSGTETVALDGALGRILAAEPASLVDIPAFDNSAMDGWALRHCDLAANQPTALVQAGISLAGHPWEGMLAAGQCIRITTGAKMPAGADTVVMQEKVRQLGDGRMEFPAGTARGDNVRYRAETLRTGAPALAAGSVLHAGQIAVLASAGIARVTVYTEPTVAIISSGDELVEPGMPLAAGQIYDANTSALAALVRETGAKPLVLRSVADDPAALKAVLQEAARQAQVILTSGGVSLGDADYTGNVLGELGQAENWSIAMRPGRPMTVGHIGETLFFGLPGNPVAAMTSFLEFVRPAIRVLRGQAPSGTQRLPALAASPLRKREGRTEFQRGIFFVDDEGRLAVRSTGPQGSAIITSMDRANCLIVLEEGRGKVAPGETVQIEPLAFLR